MGVIDPFIYIARDTAGFICPPLIEPTKKTTMASAPPITRGLPPLAKILRIRKKVPIYSAIYEIKDTFISIY
jgi:hypothetical protein